VTSFIVTPSGRPLSGIARVPGDKSIGHRALLFSALADGAVEINGLGGGADNARTRRAIEQMGVGVEVTASGTVMVRGVGVDGLRAPTEPIDCGNSGTTMRLLCGVVAGQKFSTELSGDESLTSRPMKRVAEPLGKMGAKITGGPGAKAGEIYPPLRVTGGALRGIDYASPVASAQVKSAVILAALWAQGRTTVKEPERSRDHTERMLAGMGAPIRVGADGVIAIEPAGWNRKLAARPVVVPGDPSAAAFMVAAALVAGVERIAVADVCVNETRTGFLDAIAAMGGLVEQEARSEGMGEPTADLVASRGAADHLAGTIVAGELTVRAIDELPILAIVAARAKGTTEFRDAAELRVKESDRIATTCKMLRALGVEVRDWEDGFAVEGLAGKPFKAARIDARGDHRIAMAGAVAGLAAEGPVRIDDCDNVATSFPRFVDVLRDLGGDIAVESSD
jgi:3-phosphoshikimate 1-carboxyvinyltransferase